MMPLHPFRTRLTAGQAEDQQQRMNDAEFSTERKQAEEALRKAEADLAHVTRVMTVGELTASIAHHGNQPLAAVVTNDLALAPGEARPSVPAAVTGG
jgi:C4-dicarboxylate-specific signal transduction histidine kinase